MTLDRLAWHEVEVLKFVHRHFILDRADVVMYQRGLSRVLTRAVKGLTAWVTDEVDRDRVPQRLKELVEIAADGYARIRAARPDGVPIPDAGDVLRLGVGRGVIDYVASLSDDQALAVSEAHRRPTRPTLGHRAEPLTGAGARRGQAGDPAARAPLRRPRPPTTTRIAPTTTSTSPAIAAHHAVSAGMSR